MNRRQALGLGIGAAIAIPAGLVWWNKTRLKDTGHLLTEEQKATLTAAVDTIIPASDTPGAKELGVDLFLTKMLTDCYDAQAQEIFQKGLKQLNSQGFAGADSAERLKIISDYPKDDGFIKILRELTILGYTKSEYYMENIQHYEFIPGRYIGCVNIS